MRASRRQWICQTNCRAGLNRQQGHLTQSVAEALDRDGVQSRVTLTRVVLFGGFGLLAKKSQKLAYLQVTDREGVWFLQVPNIDSMRLQAGVTTIKQGLNLQLGARSALPPPGVASAALDPAARLQRLEDLRQQGLVTEAEYAERRAAIIADL